MHDDPSAAASADPTAVLAGWLEHERRRVWSAWQRHGGVAPAGVIFDWLAERNAEGDMTLRQGRRPVSPFATLDSPIIGALMEPGFDSEAESCASLLYNTFASRCYFYSPFVNVRFEKDPRAWLKAALLGPIRDEYLSSLTSLDTPNIALSRSIAAEAYALLDTDQAIHVTVLPVGGIKPDNDDVSAGDVRIRTLTSLEIGAQAVAQFPPPPGFPKRSPWPPRARGPLSSYALEVRERGPKTRQLMGEGLAKRMVLALQLMGYELFGSGQATTWREPGPSPGIGGLVIQLAEGGEERECSTEQLARARAVAGRVPGDVFTAAAARSSIALHRFYLGAIDPSPADAIIDFAIALESVLLQQESTELAFRFRLFGAYFLAPHDTAMRREVSSQLRKVYDVRSRIVHGSGLQSLEALDEMRGQARALTAQVLVKGLEEGWPSSLSLLDAVIEGGTDRG